MPPDNDSGSHLRSAQYLHALFLFRLARWVKPRFETGARSLMQWLARVTPDKVSELIDFLAFK